MVKSRACAKKLSVILIQFADMKNYEASTYNEINGGFQFDATGGGCYYSGFHIKKGQEVFAANSQYRSLLKLCILFSLSIHLQPLLIIIC